MQDFRIEILSEVAGIYRAHGLTSLHDAHHIFPQDVTTIFLHCIPSSHILSVLLLPDLNWIAIAEAKN